MTRIEIDENSGFCFGVVNAIRKAEEELAKTGRLYCLGDIVHNNSEVVRLQEKGLVTIDHETFSRLRRRISCYDNSGFPGNMSRRNSCLIKEEI